MKIFGFWAVPIILAAMGLALLFGGSVASALEIDDFSQPLWLLYDKIQPGISHIEVNKLLKKYSFGRNKWEISAENLRDRSDTWNISLQHYFEDPFTSESFVSYDLFIYFVGTKVGCTFYRHWATGGYESAQRGRFCYLFGKEQ